MCYVQIPLCPGHGDVGQPPSSMSDESLNERECGNSLVLQADQKYHGNSRPLAVCSHERHRHIGFVLIGISHQGRVIDEIAQTLGTLLIVINCRRSPTP